MVLELKLIKLLIAERAKFRRHATEGPDKPELNADEVNGEAKPGLPRKLEAMLGFLLHLRERISRRQKVCVQVDAVVRRKTEVADLVRGLERATQRVAAASDVFRPRHHVTGEDHQGSGLESLQAALFDQVIAEPAELKPGLVIGEVRSGDL